MSFLLGQSEAIKDAFPPSDKSLGKLLGEVPYLPHQVLKLLEGLCCPVTLDKSEESQIGDRVTQGLSAVWGLILLRPPLRDSCLNIALQVFLHRMSEVSINSLSSWYFSHFLKCMRNFFFPLSLLMTAA